MLVEVGQAEDHVDPPPAATTKASPSFANTHESRHPRHLSSDDRLVHMMLAASESAYGALVPQISPCNIRQEICVSLVMVPCILLQEM